MNERTNRRTETPANCERLRAQTQMCRVTTCTLNTPTHTHTATTKIQPTQTTCNHHRVASSLRLRLRIRTQRRTHFRCAREHRRALPRKCKSNALWCAACCAVLEVEAQQRASTSTAPTLYTFRRRAIYLEANVNTHASVVLVLHSKTPSRRRALSKLFTI